MCVYVSMSGLKLMPVDFLISTERQDIFPYTFSLSQKTIDKQQQMDGYKANSLISAL